MGIEEIRKIHNEAGQPKEIKVRWLKQISDKKRARLAEGKKTGSDEAMDKWFLERRAEMTGICIFCKGKTEKDNDGNREVSDDGTIKIRRDISYRNSAAHLFPKRKNMFPSIALHPENCLELCFFGNSCHTNFDAHMIELEDVKYNFPQAWEIIIRKAKILYYCMTKEEKARVPEILLTEII